MQDSRPTTPAQGAPASTEARLRGSFAALTRAERQLAAHILNNYPVSALGTVTNLAHGAGVSGPTVIRLVQKLGFSGYPEFQAALREEIGDRLASPLAKREKWGDSAPAEHILDRFAEAVVANLGATLDQIDHAGFDTVADLLADPKRRVYLMGGRITHAVAVYLASVLGVMRGDVVLLSDMSKSWPPALLDMSKGDVLVVFDIRRYEASVAEVAELARERGAEVVLITDRWISPAAAHAGHLLPCHIEVPSAWDSNVPLLMLVEALIAAVQNRNWDETRARLTRMEELYDRTQFFRR